MENKKKPEIRIGNDIAVVWSFFTPSDTQPWCVPYDLTGLSLKLYLCKGETETEKTDFTVLSNQLSWTFLGKDQAKLGSYTLKLVVNQGLSGQHTIDVLDFVSLTAHSGPNQGGIAVGGNSQASVNNTVNLVTSVDWLYERAAHATATYATKAEMQAAIAAIHTHANLATLNQVTPEKINQWDSGGHSHTNKSVLDGITSILVNAWNAVSTWVLTNGANVLSHIADTTVHVTSQLVAAWNAKYDKPASGIPKTDLASDVQTSLRKADSALQSHQSLAAYRKSADQDVIDAGKQATISDLETIRNGAALGATALQSVPNTYRTAAEQDAIHDSTKQDVISDLDTIRSGAALGATALQPVSGTHTNEIVTLDSGGNVQASGKTVADVTDIIYGYMHEGSFYEDSAHTTAITPAANKQYMDMTAPSTPAPYVYNGSAYVSIGGGDTSTLEEVAAEALTDLDYRLRKVINGHIKNGKEKILTDANFKPVNNLTTVAAVQPLSASQGKYLKDLSDTNEEILAWALTELALVKSAVNNIAREYSPSTAYNVDEYCIHDGLLFRCTTATSASVSFDPSKWTQTNVMDELIRLTSN